MRFPGFIINSLKEKYVRCRLELCRLRCPWERNHVADVLHTCDEEDETLETESETTVRTCSVLTCVEIPPHILHRDMALIDFCRQLLKTLLTYGTADNLADLREENVGALNGLAALAAESRLLIVYLHIECLDSLRIVCHDNRLLEVFLHEVALMLRSEVVAPLAWELELSALGDGVLQNLDTLGVWQTYEV